MAIGKQCYGKLRKNIGISDFQKLLGQEIKTSKLYIPDDIDVDLVKENRFEHTAKPIHYSRKRRSSSIDAEDRSTSRTNTSNATSSPEREEIQHKRMKKEDPTMGSRKRKTNRFRRSSIFPVNRVDVQLLTNNTTEAFEQAHITPHNNSRRLPQQDRAALRSSPVKNTDIEPQRHEKIEPNLCKLPNECVVQILSYTLPHRNTVIRPFYKNGIRPPDIFALSSNDSGVVTKESFLPSSTIALFATNKLLYQLGTKILYGKYTFSFDDSEALRWWIQTIGVNSFKTLLGSNFCKVRRLVLQFKTGWSNVAQHPAVFDDQCYEERWYGLLATSIQPYYKSLTHLEISLDEWKRLGVINSKSLHTIRHWRNEILWFLHDHVRGLHHARIWNMRCTYLSKGEVNGLTQQMMLPIHTAVPRQERLKKVTLDMALWNVRQQVNDQRGGRRRR